MYLRKHFWLVVSSLLLLWVQPVFAHPHVWIQMEGDIVVDTGGKVIGANVEWTFDEAYAQAALEGLDTNGDGTFSALEIEPLTKQNMESLLDYDYFLVFRQKGEKLPTGTASKAGQIWTGDKLKLHFFVPLKTPVDPKAGEFVMKTYDPEFFLAIDLVQDEPIRIEGNLSAACQLVVKPVPTDAELEETRLMLSSKAADWQPENGEDFGAMFAQAITLTC